MSTKLIWKKTAYKEYSATFEKRHVFGNGTTQLVVTTFSVAPFEVAKKFNEVFDQPGDENLWQLVQRKQIEGRYSDIYSCFGIFRSKARAKAYAEKYFQSKFTS